MSGMNRAFLLGHLGQDPELRTTQSGMTMLKVSLATPHAKKVNDEWVETPDWHRITVFGKDAEYIGRVAHKGTLLGVECAIRPSKWTDKNGNTQYGVELVVDKVICCIPKGRGTPLEVEAGSPAPRPPRDVQPSPDEIPF